MRGATVACGLVALTAALFGPGPAGAQDPPRRSARGDTELIASAMAAAPRAVARGARIEVPEANGTIRVLRKGSNQFTCFPDSQTTPGSDPQCADSNALEYLQALAARKPPPRGKIGMIYRLLGGVDASSTDPFAARPEPGGTWIRTGPHVVIVGADQAFYDQYPKGAKPDPAVPYVMWAGTPYQRLMVPAR